MTKIVKLIKENTYLNKYDVFLTTMKHASIISLKISKTKHLLCRARINGHSAVLLVDTGASNSCIHSELQEAFQLKIKGDPFDAAGASEGKMKATMTQKCELHLGRHKLAKHAFVLLDLSHVNQTLDSQGAKPIDGILGADFLIKNKIVIDYRKRKLIL